jgi:hypothetical protein
MKRKIFLNRLLQIGGAVVLIPSAGLFTSCSYTPKIRTELTTDDIGLLDEIGEIIIPATEGVPGAKAAEIGSYMLLMVQDCYSPEKQQLFLAGLNHLDAICANHFNTAFQELNSSQKFEALELLRTESTEQTSDDHASPYFDIFKQLTISGYFSSEIGMTQARQYLPIPAKYESCISYDGSQLPWAS